MSLNDGVPTVSLTNTKKELFEAYEIIKKRVVEQKQEILNVDKARKEAEKNAAQAVAEKETEKEPIKRLYELKDSFGKEILELAERFTEEIEAFKQIQIAIDNKKEELEKLYGVEVAIGDLAELISHNNELKASFDKEILEQREVFNQGMVQQKNVLESEKAEALEEFETKQIRIKQNWEREQEEYEYSIKREHDKRRDELEDELSILQVNLDSKLADFKENCKNKQTELSEREQDVAVREEKVEALQSEIAGFDEKLTGAVEKAVNDCTKILTTEFKANQALEKATHEGQSSVYMSKIESLEKQVVSQAKQIEQLSFAQEAAYQKVQDIAGKAVEASRRDVVFSSPTAKQEN